MENKVNKVKKSPTKKVTHKKAIKKNIGFDRLVKTNLYLNDINYYFKNNIKMNKRRQKELEDIKLKKSSFQEEFEVPKMIYCNSLLNTLVDKEMKELKESKNANASSSKPQRIKKIREKVKTKTIEKAISEKFNKEKEKIHAKKTLILFDEFIKSVDTLNLYQPFNDSEKQYEIFNFEKYKQQYKKNNNSNDNNNDKELTNKQLTKTGTEFSNQIYNPLLTENKITSNILIENNNNDNESNLYLTSSPNQIISSKKNWVRAKTVENKEVPKKNILKKSPATRNSFSNMTLISDPVLFTKIKEDQRDYKNMLYFSNYGKYKYTKDGIYYPQILQKHKIPEYKGNDKDEGNFYNYRMEATNPKQVYQRISTFSEKFNKDLAIISATYGKEESKGRFVNNPLIAKLGKNIEKYEKYKDVKKIENRYVDKINYKFKLLPLKVAKKNNFDKLGNIVYEREHKRPGFFEE